MDSINLGVRGMSFASLDIYVCVYLHLGFLEMARIPPGHSRNVTPSPLRNRCIVSCQMEKGDFPHAEIGKDNNEMP